MAMASTVVGREIMGQVYTRGKPQTLLLLQQAAQCRPRACKMRRLFFYMPFQLIEDVLELVELLARLAQLALRGQALVVGEVLAGLGDEARSYPSATFGAAWDGACVPACGAACADSLGTERRSPLRRITKRSADSKVGP